jgi:23S rRNA (cytosine1962-C5)-methyltransferase
MPEPRPSVRLATDELPSGPWVFSRQLGATGNARDGDLVEVRDASNRFVGHALFNGRSDISLRFLSRGKKSDLDRPREFLMRRLRDADRLRRHTLRLAEVTDAYRVAHAEGDDLPGLIVDRLGPALVCEHHALGFWRLRREVDWALGEIYPDLRVVHRVAKTAAKAEQIDPAEIEAEPAEPFEVEIGERGLRYPVAPGERHKTGWFCDQRDNRVRVGELARGRSVLDLCCNGGGFALQAAAHGAREVTGVDLDEVALERARRAAELNTLRARFVHADAFDFLREVAQRGERFGVVVVDPHKMIASKQAYDAGLDKYLDLNALALRCAAPGALVATFSCSGLLPESGFVGVLFQAARRAGRGLRLLGLLGAGPDHPQRPEFSRSRYLKGVLAAID